MSSSISFCALVDKIQYTRDGLYIFHIIIYPLNFGGGHPKVTGTIFCSWIFCFLIRWKMNIFCCISKRTFAVVYTRDEYTGNKSDLMRRLHSIYASNWRKVWCIGKYILSQKLFEHNIHPVYHFILTLCVILIHPPCMDAHFLDLR